MDGPPGPSHRWEAGQLWPCRAVVRIGNPAEAARHVRGLAPGHGRSLVALYLDRASNLLATGILVRGDDGEFGVKPMQVIRQAEQLGAIGFIIVHHDPAGRLRPAAEELQFAHDLRRAGEDFEICLFHYLVLGRDRIREVAA